MPFFLFCSVVDELLFTSSFAMFLTNVHVSKLKQPWDTNKILIAKLYQNYRPFGFPFNRRQRFWFPLFRNNSNWTSSETSRSMRDKWHNSRPIWKRRNGKRWVIVFAFFLSILHKKIQIAMMDGITIAEIWTEFEPTLASIGCVCQIVFSWMPN